MGQMWCLHYHGVSVIRLHSVLMVSNQVVQWQYQQ
nr:MAG TPA: hypothetical protein [Caudoviricetes sp.]